MSTKTSTKPKHRRQHDERERGRNAVPRRSRRWQLKHADCLDALPKLQANSIDAIITDPPYGLEFMGKRWDRLGDIGQASHAACAVEGQRMQEWHEAWAREALRVLKPGAYLLAFGGTRTFHRLTTALENAGFEIRDCLCWLYGQGFPKSLNVAKAIDKTEKQAGSRAARAWQGWGTALKPAWEPIILARKPLGGTVAQNVRQHHTGALNIEGCRIGFCDQTDELSSKTKNRHADFKARPRRNLIYGRDERKRGNYDPPGRWPTNIALTHTTDCRHTGRTHTRSSSHHPARRGHGGLSTTGHKGQTRLPERSTTKEPIDHWECSNDCPVRLLDAQESANRPSRFFYCAKTSQAERDAGLERLDKKTTDDGRQKPIDNPYLRGQTPRHNTHPTVKPIDLMRWLVRLITPPGGTVLDPFTGSGSTGIATIIEGAHFIGTEREAEYIPLARARIKYWARSVKASKR